jgi:hypothetical protein
MTQLETMAFMDSEKGAHWLKSKEVRDRALNHYANHLLLQAWMAVHAPTSTQCYIHCTSLVPKTSRDLSYWSVDEAPGLNTRDIKSSWPVDIFSIVPSGIEGRYNIKCNAKTNEGQSHRWMLVKNVSFQNLDPFLQHWVNLPSKEGEGIYYLDTGNQPTRLK